MSAAREAWARLMRAAGAASPEADALFEAVAARYAEPGRHYHTLSHVLGVLAELERLGAGAEAQPAAHLAGWLHDLVYDPRAADNEEQSAALARQWLTRLGLPPGLIEETCRLILLTRGHETGPDDRVGEILLDADLAILGAPAPEYDAYARAIRLEYSWVDEGAYRAGRARVLRSFLGRDAVYRTGAQRQAREARARANLGRELARLEGP